jgi:hypothetical protein
MKVEDCITWVDFSKYLEKEVRILAFAGIPTPEIFIADSSTFCRLYAAIKRRFGGNDPETTYKIISKTEIRLLFPNARSVVVKRLLTGENLLIPLIFSKEENHG